MLETKESLSKFEDKLWKTTQFFLSGKAHFQNDYSFKLLANPFPNENIHSGPYMILKANEHGRKSEIQIPDDTNIYRVGHKLAQRILQACKELETPTKEVIFDYTNSNTRIAYLENFIGKSGWMKVQLLKINSFELEEYFLMSCFTDEGEEIYPDMANRFFSLNAITKDNISTNQKIAQYSDLMVPDMDKRLIQLQQNIAAMKEQTAEETALQQLATEDERRIYLLLKDVYDSPLLVATIRKAFTENPQLTISQLLPVVTQWLSQPAVKDATMPNVSQEKSTVIKADAWEQLPFDDLRYIKSQHKQAVDVHAELKSKGMLLDLKSVLARAS
jgi:hypothetical protein